jgi:hypothetical protein
MLKKFLLTGMVAAAAFAAAQASSNASGSVAVTVQPYISVSFGGTFTLNVTNPTISSQDTSVANVTAVSNKGYSVSFPATFAISGGLTGAPSFVSALSGNAGSSSGSMKVTVTGISTTVAPNTSTGYTGSFTLTITQA